jgi:uncharacterized protein (DUF362 family)
MATINRRQFLMAGALLAASAALAAVPADLGRSGMPLPTPRHPLVVARGADYGARLRQAIARLDSNPLAGIAKGHVVIKPTLAWNRAPDQGANVHPDVLQAVIEMTLAAGAAQVTIFDRTSLPSLWAYRVSGAEQVVRTVKSRRVTLAHLTDSDFVPIDRLDQQSLTAEQRAVIGQYRVCRYLLDADYLINIATARQHPLRGASLAMANLLGLVGGGPADAAWLRQQDIELAVLSAAVRPDLTILDATRAIVRNGPMGREPQDVARWDRLVVSSDLVAVEAYGAQLFGLALANISLAESLGVGSAQLAGRVIDV